ncbi:MAG: hypothetical protein GXO42_00040 [bacterium]|nr:hypothetical protein [bacterium]
MLLAVTFEGPPFAGKSTLASLVYEYYKIKGYDVALLENSLTEEIATLARKKDAERRYLAASCLLAAGAVQLLEQAFQYLTKEIIIFDSLYSYYLIYSSYRQLKPEQLDSFLFSLHGPKILYLQCRYEQLLKRKKEPHPFSELLKSEEMFAEAERNIRQRLVKHASTRIVFVENNYEEPFDAFQKIREILDSTLKNLGP